MSNKYDVLFAVTFAILIGTFWVFGGMAMEQEGISFDSSDEFNELEGIPPADNISDDRAGVIDANDVTVHTPDNEVFDISIQENNTENVRSHD